MEQTNSNIQQSEFNMAVSYLNRLNALFYLADQASMSLDAHSWYHTLLALYRELSTYIKPEEIESKTKEIFNINNRISQANRTAARTGRQEIPPELYIELHNFELFIRQILKRTGLQMRMEQDPTKAL